MPFISQRPAQREVRRQRHDAGEPRWISERRLQRDRTTLRKTRYDDSLRPDAPLYLLLDERRDMRVVALGEGEYFLDITFTLTAAHGDVAFVSDSTHYAWPYIRMNPQFSVQGGGTMTNSEGGVNQKDTHNRVARWIAALRG